MNEHEDYEGLAAGYALHALEPEDEQRLAAHLLTCNSCARLVADTAELGAAFADFLPPEQPPPSLRARILAAAAAEPRVGSEPATAAPVSPAVPAAPAPAADAPTVVAAPGSGGDGASSRSPVRSRARRMQLRSRVAVGALAAAVGIAVAVPVTLAVADSGKSAGTNSAVEQWLLSPGSRVVTLTGTGTATDSAAAKAVMTNQGVYLVANGLPANNTDDSVYVLWAADTHGVRSALATFDVHGTSPVALKATDLPFKMSDVSQVAVSFEAGRKAPASPTHVVLSGTTA